MTRALLIGLLAALAAPASAQTFIRMDCGPTGAAFPACGAQGTHDAQVGRYYTRSLLMNAGPAGEHVIRYRLIPTSPAAEFYLGQSWTANLPTIAYGSSVFFREKRRVVGPVNWHGQAPSNRVGGKALVGGIDGAQDTWRFFGNVRSNLTDGANIHDPTRWMYRIEQNISGNPRIDLRNLVGDRWYAVQIEVRFSSGAGQANACLRVWLDNTNQSAPTQERCGFVWEPASWSASGARYSEGHYWDTAGPGSHVEFDIAAFEVGRSFDPVWSVSGQPPSPTAPSAPTNLRVNAL